MSTTEDSPRVEIGKRAADLLPVMYAAALGVGIENHRQILRDANDRTKRDYKFQQDFMRAANGLDPESPSDVAPDSEDDMGDFMVVGEINVQGGGQDDLKQMLSMLKGKVVQQESEPSPNASTPAEEPPPTEPAEPAPPPEPVAPPATSPPPPAPEPVAPLPAAVAEPARAQMPWWLQAALAAASGGALLSTGAFIGSLVSRPDTPQVTQPQDTDTDTATDIGIKRD